MTLYSKFGLILPWVADAATVGPTGLPVVVGLDLSQNLLENVETSMQLGTTLSWQASPLWTVAGNLTISSDEIIHVNGHGVSVAWNLNRIWQGNNSTRLELARDLYDYSSQTGVSALNSHIPQQGRTRTKAAQSLAKTRDKSAYPSPICFTLGLQRWPLLTATPMF